MGQSDYDVFRAFQAGQDRFKADQLRQEKRDAENQGNWGEAERLENKARALDP
jgi:hypothetical protein